MLLLLMWGWGDPGEIRLEGWCVGALRTAVRVPRDAHEDAHVERCLWRLRGGQRTETAAETGRVKVTVTAWIPPSQSIRRFIRWVLYADHGSAVFSAVTRTHHRSHPLPTYVSTDWRPRTLWY